MHHLFSENIEDAGRDQGSSIPDRLFSLLARKIGAKASLFYDITSVASYSSNAIFEYGHAKDHQDLSEINISLFMEKG